MPVDAAGEAADEADSLPSGNHFVERGRSGGFLNLEGIEGRSGVFDCEFEDAGALVYAVFDGDGLVWLGCVAVMDDVGNRFFKTELDGVDSAVRDWMGCDERIYPLLHTREFR